MNDWIDETYLVLMVFKILIINCLNGEFSAQLKNLKMTDFWIPPKPYQKALI